MYYPYIFPQQTGNHSDVRWAEIASPQSGITLRFQAEKPMDFSALHFADEDLDMGLEKKMMHQKDMHPRQETYVIWMVLSEESVVITVGVSHLTRSIVSLTGSILWNIA